MKKRIGHGLIVFFLIFATSLTIGINQASAKTQPALKVTGDSPGKGHNDEGIVHYKKEHWKVAAKHFKAAVTEDKDLPEAHYNYALTLDKMGNHKDATEHFGQALKLGKDNKDIGESEILKAHLGMK